MNFLEKAKRLTKFGFEVFPLVPDGKLPAIAEFPEAASTEAAQLEAFWQDDVLGWVNPYNVGISTSRFKGGALLVVDVDTKGKGGPETLLRLELEGKDFPETFTQTTPTGGFHLVYSVPYALKQGVDVFGPGLDVRSKGGYIVGWGSRTEKGEYEAKIAPIAVAPQWMIDACGEMPQAKEDPKGTKAARLNVDQEAATTRAVAYLTSDACDHAVEGAHGDQTTFRVCAQMKDFGLSKVNALDVLWEHWNPNCSPPWSLAELEQKIDNAYNYGSRLLGSDSPEADFEPLPEPQESLDDLSPVEKLNREFAYIVTGGQGLVLWETLDSKGQAEVQFLNEQTFHKLRSSETMFVGKKLTPVSEVWMSSAERRTYHGICFEPACETSPRFYNLWKGFAVEPLIGEPLGEAKWAFEAFLDHAKKTVCAGEPELFKWLMGYFAHLIQKPWEKPLTALVFRGKKGTGKNAFVDQVGALIRHNYLVTANRRYLSSNFNSHLQKLLLFVLDEAFWSGDKQAEGILKDLITGNTHLIEQKGREPFTVTNCTRVVILGNENWVVPASEDERRFAVFTMGTERMQDGLFFRRMREGMAKGGHSLLLQYLRDFDLSKIDVNIAPKTEGLLMQKIESLGPFHQWWFGGLVEGQVLGLDFLEGWPEKLVKHQLREAFDAYVKSRGIRAWSINDVRFFMYIKEVLPSRQTVRESKTEGHKRAFLFPNIEKSRKDFERFLGQPVEWSETELPESMK